MIRRINKVIALVLAITSICAVTPVSRLGGTANLNIFSVEAKAATAAEEDALDTVTQAMIPTNLNLIYGSAVSADPTVNTVSKYTLCGHISYTLSDAAATQMLTSFSSGIPTLISTMGTLASKGQQTIDGGNALIGTGDPTNVAKGQVYVQKGTKLKLSAEAVKAKLVQMSTLDSGSLVAMIKAEAADIPVYQYTVSSLVDGSTVAQGFSAGGTLGLALTPADTWNAKFRNATYNNLAPVPALAFTPTTGTTQYKKAIDVSSNQVIGDGMSINVIDSANNKVYVINNPVYNMLKMQQGYSSAVNRQLNIIDFSGATSLKGSLSSKLDANGTSFSILSLAVTKESSTLANKNYQYNIVVGPYEKVMLEKQVDDLNLPVTTTAAVKAMIKDDSYLMVPNIKENIGGIVDQAVEKSGINNVVTNITNSMDQISDSIDNLADSIKRKNNDVDDAWDKVFDRFDNDSGWGQRDGYRYYYDSDGVSKKGVQKINGKTYYFNRIDGAMENGWQIVDGKRCYFDPKKGYLMSNQWVEDNGEKYFVGEDGTVKKMAWVSVGGKNYYLKADGKMAKDWFKVDDSWYYFNEDGSMATSVWKTYKEKWHYLKENGQSAVGWLQLGDNWFYFKDPSAELQTGWFRADGSWYCANSDGTMKKGWAEASDGWCYLDDSTGKMKKNEWVTVDGNSYYFNVNGIMVTGSRYINGQKYVFNSDGTLS
jgi:glucan-binding YG repeat protein